VHRVVGTARRRMGRWLAGAAMTGGLVALALSAPAGAMESGHDHGCHCSTTTTVPYTTTTATTATTTTIPVSTTTVGGVTTIVSSTTRPRQTTTTVHEQIVTTTTAPGSTTLPPPGTSMRITTTTGPNHNLPFTGGDVGYPLLFGMCALVAGGLLLLRRNGGWRASS